MDVDLDKNDNQIKMSGAHLQEMDYWSFSKVCLLKVLITLQQTLIIIF